MSSLIRKEVKVLSFRPKSIHAQVSVLCGIKPSNTEIILRAIKNRITRNSLKISPIDICNNI